MSFMDWSPPTPRGSSHAQQAATDSPPRGRADADLSPASAHPLTFAHSGGEIVWRGFSYLSLDQARDVRQIIIDELTFDRLSGGGVSGALGLLVEITTAINAARRWRQCQGASPANPTEPRGATHRNSPLLNATQGTV
jgi:hypothetical protein